MEDLIIAILSPQIVPRNHFWKAFWFTLGLVVIRFAYATRPHT